MLNDIQYLPSEDGTGIDAILRGQIIGQVTYVRIGMDKLIIDYTGVAVPYRGKSIGLNLIRHVAELARLQHRRIITICPFARAMFNRYPEFDDIRLMNAH
jgi:predicted GNAT family acetyltransferase